MAATDGFAACGECGGSGQSRFGGGCCDNHSERRGGEREGGHGHGHEGHEGHGHEEGDQVSLLRELMATLDLEDEDGSPVTAAGPYALSLPSAISPLLFPLPCPSYSSLLSFLLSFACSSLFQLNLSCLVPRLQPLIQSTLNIFSLT